MRDLAVGEHPRQQRGRRPSRPHVHCRHPRCGGQDPLGCSLRGPTGRTVLDMTTGTSPVHGGTDRTAAARDVADRMATAATTWLEALDTEQKASAHWAA